MKKIFLFIAILFLLVSTLSIATVRYVSHSGSNTPPYTSWATAADSIQKCIDICVFGDTIYVANGVYEERVVMIPGLNLIGAGTDSCVIDSRNLVSDYFDVTVEIAESGNLRGFKIIVSNNVQIGIGIAGSGSANTLVSQNRILDAAIGISLDYYLYGLADISIYKNSIENVVTGINMFNSNSTIRNNKIYIYEDFQSGMQVWSMDPAHPVIDSNYIVIEGQFAKGIYMEGPRVKLTNNIVILKDTYTRGIHLGGTDSSKVFNNLIIAETGMSGIYNGYTQYLQLYNNYVTGNYSGNESAIVIREDDEVKNNVVTGGKRGVGVLANQNPVFQYNNVWNNGVNYSNIVPDSTNLSVDPMIMNDDTTQGELDFHLQMFSPLIDAGDPNILDKDGTRSDIGLYGGPFGKTYTYQDLAPKPPRNLTANVDSSTITLKWNSNTEPDFSHYNLYRDTTSNFTIDSTKLVTSLQDTIYLYLIQAGVERLYFKLTAVDNQGNESNPSEEVAVILVSIKEEWQAVNNYILYQNYPNPFNPTTKIGYKLKERGYVKLYVYDVKGELVEVLVNQTQEAGYYEVEFNGEEKTELLTVKNPFVSGVYFCQILVQNEKGIPIFSDTKKMILLK